ncbi:hypothetical protein ACIQ9I_03000 [Streptomyces sp. NPDC094461]|uniref:hypothetical protein n=1 Tax=unclassified Streptomyces TaxID=2593676 RepID=UPI003805AE49
MPRNTPVGGRESAYQETIKAVSTLDRQLRAAGLGSLGPELDDEGGTLRIRLCRIDASTAAELTRLLRKGLRGAYKVASDLHAALRAHDLEGFPEPQVYEGEIRLGEVSVSTADRLALILGAPPQPELVEDPDWPEAQQVYERLDTAFKKATSGGFMDMYLHPYCQRCNGDPAIALGHLTVPTARRFLTALQYGVRP